MEATWIDAEDAGAERVEWRRGLRSGLCCREEEAGGTRRAGGGRKTATL